MSLEVDYKWLGYILSLLMLGVSSYSDIKSREVDLRIWILFGVIGSIVFIMRFYVERDLLVYLLLSLIAPLIILPLSLANMIGFADFLAVLVLSILIPKPLYRELLLPPSLTILLISNIVYVIVLTPFIIRNMLFSRLIADKCDSAFKRFIIILTGLPMRISSFLESRFMFPLVYPVKRDDKLVWVCRSSFDINEESQAYRDSLKKLLDERLVSSDDIIIVSWGAPYILFLFIGALLYPFAGLLVEKIFSLMI
ncbi:MAG: A24 family peptidase C-terminal domain-containing protein [Sulfolobales archaeon]